MELVDFRDDYEAWHLADCDPAFRGRRARSWRKGRASYRSVFEYLLTHCKVHDTDQVTRRHAAGFSAWRLADNVSAHTVNRSLRMACASWNWGLDHEAVTTNPWARIKKVKAPRYEPRVITAQDVVEALRAARKPWVRTTMAIAVYAGLRSSEIASMVWEDIDLPGGWVTVRNDEDRVTKSGRSRRIPLHGDLRRILAEWKLQCPRGRGGHLFTTTARATYTYQITNPCPDCGADGTDPCRHVRLPGLVPIKTVHRARRRPVRDSRWVLRDASTVSHAVAVVSEEAGISFSLHDLRRVFATQLYEQGVPTNRIRDYLGHESITTTERFYMPRGRVDSADVANVSYLAG